MSRYVIENNGEREVVVGWDPPLGTFYAQIFAPLPPGEEEECIWWIGYGRGEVTSVEELGEALQEQGHALPATVKNKLLADAIAPWEPGPLQRQLGFTGEDA